MFERKVFAVFVLFILLLFLSGNGFGQDTKDLQIIRESNKVALVIGNSNYKNSFSLLKSPRNDAVKMAEALKRLGFRLVGDKAHLDTTFEQMETLLERFTDEIKSGGGVGFFYFSGHGSQDNKRDNFLIPVDTTIRYQGDLKHKALSVEQITDRMEEAKNRLNILVLDACRNNALPTGFKSGGKGLNTSAEDIPNGVYIAFAARDGQTAADGDYNGFSLYTRELLKNIEKPNTRLEDIFILTRAAVKKESGNAQIPFDYGSIDDIFYFKSDGQMPFVFNSDLQGEISFNYKVNEKFAIGKGEYEFITRWSDWSDYGLYSHSDYLSGVANSKRQDFDSIFDVTAYDMSSKDRLARINEILVLKNKSGYYALVQIKRVSKQEQLLSIKYKIIPNKLQSTWKYNPELYVSREKSGKAKFEYTNNNGKFAIGEKEFKFQTTWSPYNSDLIYLYIFDLKLLAKVPKDAVIKNSADAAKFPHTKYRAELLSVGEKAVLANYNGKYAVVKVIAITGSPANNEVEFEYEILPD